MTSKRTRLDDLLVERGLATDRDNAARLLMAGAVRVGAGDGARTDLKPGEKVDAAVQIEPVDRPRFVSRGGEKLDAALGQFAIEVSGRVCLDVGASTGGFTDVLLRRGAARVYALDVGRGQLADALRRDPRVISMERTHAARLEPTSSDHVALPEPVSLAVIDVSFISLTRVLSGVMSALSGEGEIVALVKPQFEAAPADAPGGVVRDATVRQAMVNKIADHARAIGMTVRGTMESPLHGPKGNHEFLLHLARA
ncbi:MAG TPA: TlyA family RNA methyltransferase [Candidatus Limnocylindrales bacterium]|nr:TlyA family RNA methyltransferase [Candidatus Limnocylindrales bacterium]